MTLRQYAHHRVKVTLYWILILGLILTLFRFHPAVYIYIVWAMIAIPLIWGWDYLFPKRPIEPPTTAEEDQLYRLAMARASLDKAEGFLREANTYYEQANLYRAIRQTCKSNEVMQRREKRLRREIKATKTNSLHNKRVSTPITTDTDNG